MQHLGCCDFTLLVSKEDHECLEEFGPIAGWDAFFKRQFHLFFVLEQKKNLVSREFIQKPSYIFHIVYNTNSTSLFLGAHDLDRLGTFRIRKNVQTFDFQFREAWACLQSL